MSVFKSKERGYANIFQEVVVRVSVFVAIKILLLIALILKAATAFIKFLKLRNTL